MNLTYPIHFKNGAAKHAKFLHIHTCRQATAMDLSEYLFIYVFPKYLFNLDPKNFGAEGTNKKFCLISTKMPFPE